MKMSPKSSESLESRLTAFLLESASKLADLISADIFVLIDSSAAADAAADESGRTNKAETGVGGARIWSGAASLRSAFLRDGLRARESDVEFAAAATRESFLSPTFFAGNDVIDGGSAPEESPLDRRRRHHFDLGDDDNTPDPNRRSLDDVVGISGHQPFPPSPTAMTTTAAAASSSSSRRKRQLPMKRKTRLKPKFSRLTTDVDDIEDVVDDVDNDFVVRREVIDNHALPLNLSFAGKRRMTTIDDDDARRDDVDDDVVNAFASHSTLPGVTTTNNNNTLPSSSSSSAAAFTPPCLSILSAALPTPVSPNLPPSPLLLPPLETGSSSTSTTVRELFNFSLDNRNRIASPHSKNGDVVTSSSSSRLEKRRETVGANMDALGIDDDDDGGASDNNNDDDDNDKKVSAMGLLDLTPPEREHDISDDNIDSGGGDDGVDDGGGVNGGAGRAVLPRRKLPATAAALKAASSLLPVQAVYNPMVGLPPLTGSNDDYYANITHSLLAMLSHYSPVAAAASASASSTTTMTTPKSNKNDAAAEDAGRSGGEGSSGGGIDGEGSGRGKSGGGGGGGGGGVSGGGRRGRESAVVVAGGEKRIDELLLDKTMCEMESGVKEENGFSGGNLNGVAADETVGNKPGRPRGRTSGENRRGQKPSSTHARRPFTCSLCKKTFTRKDTCREHLKRIHFREVLHCQVCNMAFNSRQTMWFHRKKTGHNL